MQALPLLSILQAAAALEPVDYTLPSPPPPERIVPDCRSAARPGDIVVCGRRSDDQRFREPPLPEGVEPPRPLGFGVAGGHLGPTVSQVQFSDGRVSKRIMVTFTTSF
jgi:hypothetical protein